MAETTPNPTLITTETAKIFPYTRTLLGFAQEQFFSALSAVPTLYNSVYQEPTEKDLEEAKATFETLTTLETAKKEEWKKTFLDLNSATQGKNLIITPETQQLSQANDDEYFPILTRYEEAKKRYNKIKSAIEKKRNNEAKLKESSSFKKGLYTVQDFFGRFVVGMISSPFWLIGQAVNFVARMLLALASVIAAVPTVVFEGVSYLVNAAIKVSVSVHSGQKADRSIQNPSKSEIDIQNEKRRVYRNLVNLLEAAMALKDSPAQKMAKALKENKEENVDEFKQGALEQILAMIDNLDHNSVLKETITLDFLITEMKKLLDATQPAESSQNKKRPGFTG